AAVALVSDDQVEGVDGDVELLDVRVDLLVVNLEGALAAKEVHGHALNGGDVHESIAELRTGQQRRRHDGGVERAIVTEVLPPEGLGVDRVDLVELQTRLGLERGELPHGLGSQSSPVDQEQDTASNARLH